MSKVEYADFLTGEKLFQKRARLALPYLVRQAKAERPIFYSALAKQIGMPNSRNLNHVLGQIGFSINRLSEKVGKHIPPIQCLVINIKDKIPGDGISGYFPSIEFYNLTTEEKRGFVNVASKEIYDYPAWDWVLKQFDLKPLDVNYKLLEEAKSFRGGGESEHHKKLKMFIASNPQVLGIKDVLQTKVEYPLPSGDKMDVLFICKSMTVGVEVKSNVSNDGDLLRGLFQCIKYKHIIEAEQAYNNIKSNCRVILALEDKLPADIAWFKNAYNIEVVDKIKVK